MKKVFIIAEAGVNHNGELHLAKKLVDAAVKARVDCVKFQTFRTEKNISRHAPKAKYQGGGESQFDMTKRLELKDSDFIELARYCAKKKVLFMSTPDDEESVALLKKIGVPVFKIASGEITNLPYLRMMGVLRKRLILSTGMADMKEIGRALDILIKGGTARGKITLLHCTTEYPAPFADVNLRAMLTMKNKFRVEVGYSDHTSGIEVAVAAVALGATVVEKHFTLDKQMPGPDHKASLSPEELYAMVKAIRNVELSLGSMTKRAARSEMKNIPVVRRSIFAACPIRKGEVFTENNLIAKRPATGISPMAWDRVIGRRAAKDFKEDDQITL